LRQENATSERSTREGEGKSWSGKHHRQSVTRRRWTRCMVNQKRRSRGRPAAPRENLSVERGVRGVALLSRHEETRTFLPRSVSEGGKNHRGKARHHHKMTVKPSQNPKKKGDLPLIELWVVSSIPSIGCHQPSGLRERERQGQKISPQPFSGLGE